MIGFGILAFAWLALPPSITGCPRPILALAHPIAVRQPILEQSLFPVRSEWYEGVCTGYEKEVLETQVVIEGVERFHEDLKYPYDCVEGIAMIR